MDFHFGGTRFSTYPAWRAVPTEYDRREAESRRLDFVKSYGLWPTVKCPSDGDFDGAQAPTITHQSISLKQLLPRTSTHVCELIALNEQIRNAVHDRNVLAKVARELQ